MAAGMRVLSAVVVPANGRAEAAALKYRLDHVRRRLAPCDATVWRRLGAVAVVLACVLVGLLVKNSLVFECPAGYYCLKQTFTYPCPPGRYGAQINLLEANCTGPCEAGYYCAGAATSPQEVICPAGSYCPPSSGAPLACPSGTFGAAQGLAQANCSGDCAPGFYCPAGSASSRAIACPVGSYCPARSALPEPCPDGFYGSELQLSSAACTGLCQARPGEYCPQGSTQPDLLVACPAGSYCTGESGAEARRLCPAGRFGDREGLTNAACSGECEAGFHCPAGSTSSQALPCPAGHYCVAGAKAPEPCPSGTYGANPGQRDASCEGNCAAGFWCPAGSLVPEPEPCPAGFFCPTGTANYSANECWPGYACPTGTLAPKVPCDRGHFCPAGTANADQWPCPPGTWNGVEGKSECTEVCPESFYCDGGTVNPFERLCPPGSYCPEGTNGTRAHLCPGGTFSTRWGLITAEECACNLLVDPFCEQNGVCSERYYCPPGSASPREVKCPANYYCPPGSSEPLLCRAPGYYCPERSRSEVELPNDVSIFLLNNIEQRAQLWARDNRAVAEVYAFEGMSQVEAFLFDISRTTYGGSLYEGLYFNVNRGEDVIVANLTTRGFFNASVYICDEAGNTEDQIGEIALPAPSDEPRSAQSTFSVSWPVPREVEGVNKTVCLRIPRGEDPAATLMSDSFGVRIPSQLEPLRAQVLRGTLSALLGLWFVLSVRFLWRAPYSRRAEVSVLMRFERRSATLVLQWLGQLQVAIQAVALVFWHPVAARRGPVSTTLQSASAMAAGHFTPFFGPVPVLVGLATVSVCALAPGRIRLAEPRKRVVRLVLFDIFYMPVQLALLAPLECVYTDAELGHVFFSFADEAFVRSVPSIGCWRSAEHVVWACASILLATVFFWAAARDAYRLDDKAPLVVLPLYKLSALSARTVVAFLCAVVSPSQSTFEATLFYAICALAYAIPAKQYLWRRPVLGHTARFAAFACAAFSTGVLAALFGWLNRIVISGLEDSDSDPVWPFLALLGSAGVLLAVLWRRGRREARRLAVEYDFVELVHSEDPAIRQECLDGAILMLYTLVSRGNSSARKTRVVGFLEHLGELTQVRDPAVSDPARRAVLALLESNANSVRFVVKRKYLMAPCGAPVVLELHDDDDDELDELGELGEHGEHGDSQEPQAPGPDAGVRKQASARGERALKLIGEPAEMLAHCFRNVSTIDLSYCGVDDPQARRLVEFLPELQDLHALLMESCPAVGAESLVHLLEAIRKSTSVMRFVFGWGTGKPTQELREGAAEAAAKAFAQRLAAYAQQRDKMDEEIAAATVLPVTRLELVDVLALRVNTGTGDSLSVEDEHEAIVRHLAVGSELHIGVDLPAANQGDAGSVVTPLLAHLVPVLAGQGQDGAARLDLACSAAHDKVALAEELERFGEQFPRGCIRTDRMTVGASQTALALGGAGDGDVSPCDVAIVRGLLHTRYGLRALDLRGAALSELQASGLGEATLLPSCQLEEVVLGRTPLRRDSLGGAEQSAGTAFVLEFSGDQALSNLDMAYLAPIISMHEYLSPTKLRVFSEDRAYGLGESGVERLAGSIRANASLQRCLTKLALGNWQVGCKPGMRGATALSGLFEDGLLPALVSLDLRNNGLDARACGAIAAALETAHSSGRLALASLKLSQNCIGDDGAEALGAMLAAKPGITKLHVSHNGIGSQGLAALAAGLDGAAVRELVLDGNDASDEAAQRALCNALRGVHALSLVGCGLTYASALAQFLRAAPGRTALRSLNLASNPGLLAVDICAALVRIPQLETLVLQRCGLTDSHLDLLLEALRSPGSRLANLDLSANSLTDHGLLALADTLLALEPGTSLLACITVSPAVDTSPDARDALAEAAARFGILLL